MSHCFVLPRCYSFFYFLENLNFSPIPSHLTVALVFLKIAKTSSSTSPFILPFTRWQKSCIHILCSSACCWHIRDGLHFYCCSDMLRWVNELDKTLCLLRLKLSFVPSSSLIDSHSITSSHHHFCNDQLDTWITNVWTCPQLDAHSNEL